MSGSAESNEFDLGKEIRSTDNDACVDALESNW